jgi:hypothetical protein
MPSAMPADRMRLRDAWQEYAWWTGAERSVPALAAADGDETDAIRPGPPPRIDQAAPASGRTLDVLEAVRSCLDRGTVAEAVSGIASLGNVSGSRAGTWFTAYDEAGEPLADGADGAGDGSVSSRAWADIAQLAVGQIIGLRPEADGVRVMPRLLPGVDRMTATLRIREMTLSLEVLADDAVGLETSYRLPYRAGEIAAQLKARRAPVSTA